MKGKKLISFLLSLIMVITLLPFNQADVHASDKKKCIRCDQYTDSYCTDCESDHLCVCDSCHYLLHCGFCNGCYINSDVEFCDDNCFGAICIDCAEQEGYHCTECHKCYMGDEEVLCGNCFICPDCIEICDTCGWCFECQKHCPECDSCDYEDEKCEQDGEHCKECCIICEECEECLLAKDQKPCEYCERCEDCCEYNSCEYCGMCEENPDYESHLCAECGTCFEITEQCETCGLCEDCCFDAAVSLGCECGEYCQDEVNDDHLCDNCGQCFGIVEFSREAEDRGLCLCEDCFAEVLEMEEEAGEHSFIPQNTWSISETQHWKECKFCDEPEHRSTRYAHSYNERGVCKTCGYKDGSNIYITSQPKNKSVDICLEGTEKDKAYVNVSAIAKSPLTYRWEYKRIGYIQLVKEIVIAWMVQKRIAFM